MPFTSYRPVIALMFSFCLYSGCRSHVTEYDISSAAPFSKYSNQTVALTRPMTLRKLDREYKVDGQFEGFNLQEAAEPNPHAYPSIALPAGYSVHVANTWVHVEEQPLLSGGFKSAWVTTRVIVDVDCKGWPKTVSTRFQPCWTTTDIRGPIPIQVSPWEPDDTPKERAVIWPDEKMVVKHFSR
jgi:hypothetical protein